LAEKGRLATNTPVSGEILLLLDSPSLASPFFSSDLTVFSLLEVDLVLLFFSAVSSFFGSGFLSFFDASAFVSSSLFTSFLAGSGDFLVTAGASFLVDSDWASSLPSSFFAFLFLLFFFFFGFVSVSVSSVVLASSFLLSSPSFLAATSSFLACCCAFFEKKKEKQR
jgi:hypothetical protein